ncbi:hypothetical protein CEXT_754881 [Caerostris extrusa]|uniref:Uncharacterized protein n=1 Tax=Caerostris extrusa TaxID=172846 RepID=A0AAV4SJX8_CAEEX|nr:hypothetical protein CEXT_754881 [Caerostris extrusa]
MELVCNLSENGIASFPQDDLNGHHKNNGWNSEKVFLLSKNLRKRWKFAKIVTLTSSGSWRESRQRILSMKSCELMALSHATIIVRFI